MTKKMLDLVALALVAVCSYSLSYTLVFATVCLRVPQPKMALYDCRFCMMLIGWLQIVTFMVAIGLLT